LLVAKQASAAGAAANCPDVPADREPDQSHVQPHEVGRRAGDRRILTVEARICAPYPWG
jgi:hypothetical protein